MPVSRPPAQTLQRAYGATVPDLVGPQPRVLLCGINPSLWSGAVGLHFANPGNRLWLVLAGAGWTPRRLLPSDTAELVAAGIAVTNLVARATARADELTDDELRAGLPAVEALAERVRPRWVAFLGLGAYRTATGDRTAQVGRQARRLGPAGVWLLPNPSGLNASWQLPRLVGAYAELWAAADPAAPGDPGATEDQPAPARPGTGDREQGLPPARPHGREEPDPTREPGAARTSP